MSRQEKISLLMKELEVHGLKKNHVKHLNLIEIDQTIESLAMISHPVNKRERPPKPPSNNYLVQSQYRDNLVEYIKEEPGLELPHCLPVDLYEAIVKCYKSKQAN